MHTGDQPERSGGTLAQVWDKIRGQSTVIGVILMVAIMVILAAVAAAFVLGIGDEEEEPGFAALDVDVEPDGVTVIHDGGDNFDPINLELIVDQDGERETYRLDEQLDGDDDVFDAGTRIFAGTDDGGIGGFTTLDDEVTVFVRFIPNEDLLFQETFALGTGGAVDVTLDDDDPFVGEELSFEVEAGNEAANNVTLKIESDPNIVNDTEVLEPGDTYNQTLDTAPLPDNNVEISAELDDDGEVLSGDSISLDAPELGIDSVELDGGNDTVAVTVENNGEIGHEDDIEVDVADGPSESTDNVELDGGESEQRTINITLNNSDQVTVEFGEDEVTRTVGAAEFEIDEIDAEEPVDPDEFDVNATIENNGDNEGDREIELSVDGESADTKTLELEGGETETVTLTYDEDTIQEDEVAVTVDTGDDEESATLDVATSDFQVEIDDIDPDGNVDPNETLEVNFTVENDGELDDTQEVNVSTPADEATVEATVESGESESFAGVEVDAPEDPGEFNVTVSSEDDTAEKELTVTAGSELTITEFEAPSVVSPGDDITVDVTVENQGGEADSDTVNFLVDDQEEESKGTGTLEPGEDTTVDFETGTESETTVEVAAELEEADESESQDVFVTDAELLVSVDDVTKTGDTAEIETTFESLTDEELPIQGGDVDLELGEDAPDALNFSGITEDGFDGITNSHFGDDGQFSFNNYEGDIVDTPITVVAEFEIIGELQVDMEFSFAGAFDGDVEYYDEFKDAGELDVSPG